MNKYNFLRESYRAQPIGRLARPFWERLHIDLPLFISVLALIGAGLFILYSASNQSIALLTQQSLRFAVGIGIMVAFAQIPPRYYAIWAPWLYGIGLVLLIAVLFVGHVQNGGRRWLVLGFIRFQPSEIMKLAMPMVLAWYLSEKTLPPTKLALLICSVMLIVPGYAISIRE